jgi:hypothetical protein
MSLYSMAEPHSPLQLGHRASVDFGFLGSRLFDPVQLAATIPFLTAATITQQTPHTLSAIMVRGGPVGISFFGLPAVRRLTPPLIAPDNGLQIASLLDLAGTKAAVVQQRAEAKDCLDLDAILSCKMAGLICQRHLPLRARFTGRSSTRRSPSRRSRSSVTATWHACLALSRIDSPRRRARSISTAFRNSLWAASSMIAKGIRPNESNPA